MPTGLLRCSHRRAIAYTSAADTQTGRNNHSHTSNLLMIVMPTDTCPAVWQFQVLEVVKTINRLRTVK